MTADPAEIVETHSAVVAFVGDRVVPRATAVTATPPVPDRMAW